MRLRLAAALCAAGAAVALVTATGALSEPAQIRAKRAEALAVLQQIQQIDSQLDQAIERYNQASNRLATIQRQLDATKRRLGITKRANRAAERNLERRVLALYQNGEQSVIEVVLGAASLDDLLEAVDAAKRVSNQDQRILASVQSTRASYRAAVKRLSKSRAEQRKVVADRAARRQEIVGKLQERQRLYNSVADELAVLEQQERQRQERLAAEAQRRLEEQQATSYASESSPTIGGPTAAVPASRYGGVVGIALAYLGTPYVWAGASPGGFDCSGFIQYVFAQVGVSLPHSTYAQYGYGVAVSQSQLEPGDLVFFDGLGHAGIYIGGGQFVHSPHTGDVVKISSIYDSWYAATWVGGRRLL